MAPARRQPPGTRPQEVSPVTRASSHGSQRRPVMTGSRHVPGLYERRLADGTLVFDAAFKLRGRVIRRRLNASTKTDAIHEIRALRVDLERGESFRSPAAGTTVNELAAEWLAHLSARVGHGDPAFRRSERTVALYEQRLRQHILPLL